jgi:hypothetical protein
MSPEQAECVANATMMRYMDVAEACANVDMNNVSGCQQTRHGIMGQCRPRSGRGGFFFTKGGYTFN